MCWVTEDGGSTSNRLLEGSLESLGFLDQPSHKVHFQLWDELVRWRRPDYINACSPGIYRDHGIGIGRNLLLYCVFLLFGGAWGIGLDRFRFSLAVSPRESSTHLGDPLHLARFAAWLSTACFQGISPGGANISLLSGGITGRISGTNIVVDTHVPIK